MADNSRLPGPVLATFKAALLLFIAALAAATADQVGRPGPGRRRRRRLLRDGRRPAGRRGPRHPEARRARREHGPAADGRPGLGPAAGQHRRGAVRRGAGAGAPAGRTRASGWCCRSTARAARCRRTGGPRRCSSGCWTGRVPASVDVVEVLGPVTERAANADAFSTTLTRAQQAQRYVDGPLQAAWTRSSTAPARRCSAAPSRPGSRPRDRRSAGGWTLAVTKAYVRRRLPGPGRLRRLPPGPADRGGAAGLGAAGGDAVRPTRRSGCRSGS